jgi:hypothetical protein
MALRLDNIIYVLQDKMIDTKRVLERIRASWQSDSRIAGMPIFKRSCITVEQRSSQKTS